MFNDKQKLSVYSKYHVSNVAKSEDFVHIIRPDKSSEVYKQFEKLVSEKVDEATKWLSDRNIEYTWNEWIDGHLYRLCIPDKDLLFDFEYYPVINTNYNYIRIDFLTNIINVLEKIFPEIILDTSELNMHYRVSQKEINRFLRENGHAPVYDKSILRLAWIKDCTIYQCILLKENRIVVNVTRRNCKVNWGTFMTFRYLTEVLCFPEIIIKDSLDNSFTTDFYQLCCKVQEKKPKKKIWWSPEQTKWHIDDKSNYMPFYFTENITYLYKIQN